jgi:creatine kinase/arginine kinase
MRDELEKMENCRLVLKRNFRGMPFLPHMSKDHKLQVERKVIELVGELYGQYKPLSALSDEEKEWYYTQHGIDLEADPLLTAAGINDDYPLGRGIFKEEHDQFLILVNFEDHVEIQMLPGAGPNIFNSLE